MAEIEKRQPWLVRIHYRMRTVAFAMLLVVGGLHIAGKDAYGPGTWVLLGLLFLAYPQIQFWRASRAANSLKAELDNLRIDSALLGMFAAALAFPAWITFSAAMGTLSNNALNRGWRGVLENVLIFLGGALAWVMVAGFRFSPDTDWPVTLGCIVGLGGYLMAVGNIGFTRIVWLRQAREKLQDSERALLVTNDALRAKLAEIDSLHALLQEQAIRDPLTGLYNRRYLDSTLERELARSKREGQSLALIMIDIDHFKQVNDTYGHQAGDAILVQLGAILGNLARSADVACRYGGEEFLLLIPTMPLDTARERAEDLRESFSALEIPFGDFRLQTTISIGIAVYPGHGTSEDELIRSADRALYRAKHQGRNRVEA